jgi:Asp-tRNA(Asn)/Glu-tRNA(Gln) amidotransferase A subunit family amidase
VASGTLIPAVIYLKAQRIRQIFIQDLYKALNGNDCIVTPSAPTSAPRGLESTGNSVFNVPWSFSGFPSITVPSGFNEDGLPIGIQLIAKPYQEGRLFQIAQWFETIFDFPKEPREPII